MQCRWGNKFSYLTKDTKFRSHLKQEIEIRSCWFEALALTFAYTDTKCVFANLHHLAMLIKEFRKHVIFQIFQKQGKCMPISSHYIIDLLERAKIDFQFG